MQKWEYKVLRGYPSEQQLTQLGNEGWDLVAVVTGGAAETQASKDLTTGWGAQDVYAYFKRPKN